MEIVSSAYKKDGFLRDHIIVVDPTDEDTKNLEKEGWMFYSYIQRLDERKEIHFTRE